MRRLALAATALLALAAPALTAGTASAAPAPVARECITKAEFNAIDIGMTPSQVKEVVGTLGRMQYGVPFYRSYDIPHCGPSRVPAMVNFEVRRGILRLDYALWSPDRG